MDQNHSDNLEGAPACAQNAGANAPSGGAGLERRNSARRKYASMATVFSACCSAKGDRPCPTLTVSNAAC
jgi:hypothetical protein